ncbi:MAG: hypothetical protein WC342_02235 [Methanoregula sp.]
MSAIFPDPVTVTPTQSTTIPTIQTPESPGSVIPVSRMALLPEDLPADYILKERADQTYLEMDPIFRDLGWKSGYFVSYYRMNREKYDITGFSQTIGLYSLNTITLVFNERKDDALQQGNASIKIYVMPCRKMGENTFAYKIVDENLPLPINRYTILFTQKDIYEELTMEGTTTDYETLKDFAAAATEKIH